MNLKKMPVLLIYPTNYRVSGLPIGIASIAAVLKREEYDVKIFDTAFYPNQNESNQNETRSKKGMSKKIVNEDVVYDNTGDMFEDLRRIIMLHDTKIVGISLLQSTYEIGVSLTRFIKANFPYIIIVAGGVLPTLIPDMIFEEPSIDSICLGEGEMPFLKFCDRFSSGSEDIVQTPGFWIKWHGTKYKNKPAKVCRLEELPYPDFSEFDSRLFFKPMQGRLYKMINIETTRGCPHMCTYCSAPSLRAFFKQNECGTYYRKMDIDYITGQIDYQVNKYKPEFIYFSSEMFLAFSDEEFSKFEDSYSKHKIPFWFQTRFETVTKERLEALKKIGMLWITLGLEHGNEEFRKKMLKRNYSNEKALECVKILKEVGVGASINNIIGFPGETRELIFDTININKRLYEINNLIECNVFMFTPFLGSDLYDYCAENNLLISDEKLTHTSLYRDDDKILNYNENWNKELGGLSKTFNLYVKLDEKYYPQIKIAEKNDAEGIEMLDKLLKLI